MNEPKQLINNKEQYEEPKIDVILFACVRTDSVSDNNDAEWDELG